MITAASIRELYEVYLDDNVAVPKAEAYLTAYQALVWNCDLKDNETALIHAVSCFSLSWQP